MLKRDLKKVVVCDVFNMTVVATACGLLGSLFPVMIYAAWIYPSLVIGPKLKFPRGREILEEPIDLDYFSLSDMICGDHGDDNLYFLALTELKNRLLHKDATKHIATEFF